MENTMGSQKRNISYAPLKSILKSLSFVKREEIHNLIGSVQKTSSLFPYAFGTVRLTERTIRMDDREYNFRLSHDHTQNYRNFEGDFNKAKAHVFTSHYQKKAFSDDIQMTIEEAYTKVFDEFFRNGTKIECLVLDRPLNVFKGKNKENFKLDISGLKYVRDWGDSEALNYLLPLIEHSKLETIEFTVFPETIKLFDMKMVRKCNEVILHVWHNGVPFINSILNLTNERVYLNYYGFGVEDARKLAQIWLKAKRPIGTKFSVAIRAYDNVIDVMMDLNQAMGAAMARLPDRSNSFYANCATIKMSDEAELVVSGEPNVAHRLRRLGDNNDFCLVMEVMKRGSSTPKNF